MLSLSVSFQLYRMNYEGPALGDLIGQFEPSLTLTSAMIPGSIKRPYIPRPYSDYQRPKPLTIQRTATECRHSDIVTTLC